MELYGFMEREKKIPSYFFIITKVPHVICSTIPAYLFNIPTLFIKVPHVIYSISPRYLFNNPSLSVQYPHLIY